jgi:hypothetical protein
MLPALFLLFIMAILVGIVRKNAAMAALLFSQV